MTTIISNDVNLLDANFKNKFNAWWAEVIAKYPNARVFEARRSVERQRWLYASGRTRPGPIVTWTLYSKHLEGKAVDIVFMKNGQPTWNGPYDDIIEMAKKYGIDNLKPMETCHFECDGSPHAPTINPLLQRLIDDKIRDGKEGEGVSNRVALLVAKAIYK